METWKSWWSRLERIDFRIARTIPPRLKRRLIVHNAELPVYRFADLHLAVEAFCKSRASVARVETQQVESLNQLIHDKAPQWADRSIRRATKTAWQTGPNDETYLPVDCFWLCPSEDIETCFVIRLQLEEMTQKARLEVACGDTDAGKAALESITEHSREHSIYRNYVLQLSYEAGKKDEYGDIEKPEQFRVGFSQLAPVTEADIVLADEHIEVLRRNVIDLHTRREILEANGVPPRRGVLLHGPPGTGKTYACRYLCGKLDGVTRIFVTGSSLQNVSAVFSFARLLQPSLLFLEDVDLVFASRDINLYSSALGDLLDQMDGLRSHENVNVILTTNAIDRLEAAIKDRPGRISQCVYMGAPAPPQRRRFLAHQLREHATDGIDIEALVRKSDGATQAFLKEWTRRAIQIACERLDRPDQKAQVGDADFDEALTEMRRFLQGSDGSIIGFVDSR